MSISPHLESYRPRQLPPVLARDYRRNIIWPHVQCYGALLILGAIILGAIR